jgi:hypothetical protein
MRSLDSSVGWGEFEFLKAVVDALELIWAFRLVRPSGKARMRVWQKD